MATDGSENTVNTHGCCVLSIKHFKSHSGTSR